MAAWGQQGRRKEAVPSGESRSKGRSFGGKADRCGQHVCRIKETREDDGIQDPGERGGRCGQAVPCEIGGG